MNPMTILVTRNRARTSGYFVRYTRVAKNGTVLHRSITCRTIEEAQAEAIDINRRLFDGRARIVGLPFGFATQ